MQRDLKAYIARHSDRRIPVGYSAADVREVLASTWNYLQCEIDDEDDDENSRADFFGLNSYSWCGSSATFQTSGYDQLVAQFSNTTIPVFFSEYGCNEVLPRTFDEVPAIYGTEMRPVLSGGLVYEYSQEESNYGLVEIEPDGSVKLRTDYENLQLQYSRIDLAALQSARQEDDDDNDDPPACDSSLIDYPSFNDSFAIPPTPADAVNVLNDGISNPNNGRIVKITTTKVSQRVEDSAGNTLDDLSIKLLADDQINTPAPVTSTATRSATSTGTGPSPTESRPSSACGQAVGHGSLVLAFILASYLALA